MAGKALPGTRRQGAPLKQAGIRVQCHWPWGRKQGHKAGHSGGKNTHTILLSDLAVPKCLLLLKTELPVRAGGQSPVGSRTRAPSHRGQVGLSTGHWARSLGTLRAAALHLVAVVVHGDQAVEVEDVATFHQLPHQVRLDGRLGSLVAGGGREALHADGAVLRRRKERVRWVDAAGALPRTQG